MPTIFLHVGNFQLAKLGNFQLAETGEFSTGTDSRLRKAPALAAGEAARSPRNSAPHRGDAGRSDRSEETDDGAAQPAARPGEGARVGFRPAIDDGAARGSTEREIRARRAHGSSIAPARTPPRERGSRCRVIDRSWNQNRYLPGLSTCPPGSLRGSHLPQTPDRIVAIRKAAANEYNRA